ncbi:DUF4157 domain-containing protein [Solitalea sp. MAHUQ-68]|uniref:DUF4157 domain-containing protein n=1 Tax=Solitalea agri TaxID=2953739 RepID=A0A9X2F591_9SPHI|nr:DUF4157 domain-containing protein [Solitalea agri]MCO4294465.1 DUF4157 domain-containing protein [Solitalea agri]
MRKCHKASVIPKSSQQSPNLEPKSFFNSVLSVGNSYEQEANEMANNILSEHKGSIRSSFFLPKSIASASQSNSFIAPKSVSNIINANGQALDDQTLNLMQSKLNYDFSKVQIHNNATAQESAAEINANAYTVKNHIVFGKNQYQPNTTTGKQLLAHELTHVVQQSSSNTSTIQRQPATPVQSDYEELVKKGKWCRDSAESGKLHPGLQCYREIPATKGHPPGQQYCFDKKTGEFKEESPDFVSAVSGQLKDGTCDIPMKPTDPPQPFTQRGQRAMGHLIGDIATEDANLIGGSFGAFTGVTMGIGLPKQGFGASSLWIPAVLGAFGTYLGAKGLPRLNKFAERHGFLPTISLGAGTNLDLKLGIGLEKRDRPLPVIPVNSYLTFGVDTTLGINDEPGVDASFMAKVGIRIDPRKQGGGFGFGSVGGGFQVGKDAASVKSYSVGAGYRFTDFLDVQVERESISGGDKDGATYWLTLKMIAPQNVLKGH